MNNAENSEVELFEGFEILWDPQGHFVNFEVHVEGETELYLRGFVKWDGCTEIVEWGHHWCGGDDLSRHLLLLQHLYTYAFELMVSCQVDDPLTVEIVRKP